MNLVFLEVRTRDVETRAMHSMCSIINSIQTIITSTTFAIITRLHITLTAQIYPRNTSLSVTIIAAPSSALFTEVAPVLVAA